MELREMERVARRQGARVVEGIDGASRSLRPHIAQAGKQLRRVSRQLRPLGKEAVALTRKYPAGALACAAVVGWLLASARRR